MTTETTDALTTDQLVRLAGAMGWPVFDSGDSRLNDAERPFLVRHRNDTFRLWAETNHYEWSPGADTPEGEWQAKQLAEAWCHICNAGSDARVYNIFRCAGGGFLVSMRGERDYPEVREPTLPMAICRAVLAAIEEKHEL